MIWVGETEKTSRKKSAFYSRTDPAYFEDELGSNQGWRYQVAILEARPHSPAAAIGSASVSDIPPDAIEAYVSATKYPFSAIKYPLVLGSSSGWVRTVEATKALPDNRSIDVALFGGHVVVVVEYKEFKPPFSSSAGMAVEGSVEEGEIARKQALTNQLDSLLLRGQAEDFDPDRSGDFSRAFKSLLAQDLGLLLPEVERWIGRRDVDEVISWGLLSLLGQIDDPDSRQTRFAVLNRALSDDRPRIRDGALIGLSWLNNPTTNDAIKLAYEREKNPVLRKTMRRLLEPRRTSH